MTNSSEQSLGRMLVLWLRGKAVFGGHVSAGLLAAGGLFVDLLDLATRLTYLLICGLIAALGLFGIRWRNSTERTTLSRALKAEEEAEFLRAQVNRSAPEAVLDVIGSALFVKPGGWRLTLFVLAPREEQHWSLEPLVTRASSEVYEQSLLPAIPLENSRLVEVLSVDVNDPLRPFTNQSANLPSRDIEPEAWATVHSMLLPGQQAQDTMHTRKFAWAATRDSSTRRTLLLLAESAISDGINLDVLGSQLIAPTVALVARMHGIQPLEGVNLQGVA